MREAGPAGRLDPSPRQRSTAYGQYDETAPAATPTTQAGNGLPPARTDIADRRPVAIPGQSDARTLPQHVTSSGVVPARHIEPIVVNVGPLPGHGDARTRQQHVANSGVAPAGYLPWPEGASTRHVAAGGQRLTRAQDAAQAGLASLSNRALGEAQRLEADTSGERLDHLRPGIDRSTDGPAR